MRSAGVVSAVYDAFGRGDLPGVLENLDAARAGAGRSRRWPRAGPAQGRGGLRGGHRHRSLMDPAGEIDRWSEFDRGGHFPAIETPELLVDDLRTFSRRENR